MTKQKVDGMKCCESAEDNPWGQIYDGAAYFLKQSKQKRSEFQTERIEKEKDEGCCKRHYC